MSFQGFEVGCVKVLEFGVGEPQSRDGRRYAWMSVEIIETLFDT